MFEVPNWVQVGLNDGTFILFGGVVRNLKGQIVYLLKNGNQVHQNAKAKLLIGGVVVIGTIIIASSAYAINKYIKKKETTIDEIVDFNEVLEKYINAGLQGKLNTIVITELHDACFELLKVIKDNDAIHLLDGEYAKVNDITNSIKQYTEQLCVANKSDEVVPIRKQSGNIKDNIIELSDYLEIQKSVFEDVANI